MAAPVFSRSRMKPEIYKTVDGKVIVEDELLNFLALKHRTLSQDEIVLVATNTFDSQWIETSKKVLFELCPTTEPRVSHEGPLKDAQNIKSCLKVMDECGDNTPRFVSHYLDELPPVTSANADVWSLLGRMKQLYAEVCSMRHVMRLQADVSEGLRAITLEINRRVCSLERSADGADAAMDGVTGSDGTAAASVSVAGKKAAGKATSTDGPGGSLLGSPERRPAVKKARFEVSAAVAKPKPSAVTPELKKTSGDGVLVGGGTGPAMNSNVFHTKLLHQTMCPERDLPPPLCLGPEKFQCRFCRRVGEYPAIAAHMQSHGRYAIRHKGYKIHKCGLGCVTNNHYHCCYCQKIINRSDVFTVHVQKCASALVQRPTTAAITAALVLSPSPGLILTTSCITPSATNPAAVSGSPVAPCIKSVVSLSDTNKPLPLPPPLNLKTSTDPKSSTPPSHSSLQRPSAALGGSETVQRPSTESLTPTAEMDVDESKELGKYS
ncbi:uncharacterized protein [Brachyistius frenatus]|uniref:uncharacterized protein n=1 Tax=Brachyistius frenatus TaxID=100188 RepID=UPI0037E936C6